jgi:ribosomal protein S18 acetylase RimI-like enzyme
VIVREFDARIDQKRIQDCFVELQDAERVLDPRLPCGNDIVGAYIPTMLKRCSQAAGKVFVAEVEGVVVGFVTVLTRVRSDELEGGDLEYGLVSDLIVTNESRRMGIGRQLLEAAESFARSRGVQCLRVGVLAANEAANYLYTSSGFSNLYVELEKDLSRVS